MPPNPATGEKVSVDPISRSASSGLPKRQGHGQWRGLQAELCHPSPQPGAQPSVLLALGRVQLATELGAQCPVLWLTHPSVTPDLEATGFDVYYLLHPAREPCTYPSLWAGWIVHTCLETLWPAASWQEQQHCNPLLTSFLHSCLSGRDGAFRGEWSPTACPFKTARTAAGCAWVPWSVKSAPSLLKPPRWQSS